MIHAADAKNMAEMLRVCGLGKSSGSTWKKRGSIPEGSLARVASKTGCDLEWLRTGQGKMFSAPAHNLQEERDEARDGYQARADGALLFERVEMRLEQAEWVLLSESKYAPLLESKIKEYYRLFLQHRRQPGKEPQPNGTDNLGL